MLLFRLLFGANYSMKPKNFLYILLACYVATFLRLIINNNLIVSLIGSLFFGFVVAKRLSYSKEQIFLSGFFSCFTSFSGFIYFLYNSSSSYLEVVPHRMTSHYSIQYYSIFLVLVVFIKNNLIVSKALI